MTAVAAKRPVADGRLIVGPVPDDFDPSHDVIAGWWCFSDREDACPGWETSDLEEPITDPDAVVAEFRAINALVNDLIIEWTPKWNEAHSVNRSEKFWHMLSVGWLIDLVHLVRYRYLEIEQVIASHPDRLLHAEVVAVDTNLRYESYREFAPASYADQTLSSWICSLILHEIDAENVELEVIPQAPAGEFKASAYTPPPGSAALKTLRRLKASLKPDRCRIGSGAREFTPWLKFSTLVAEYVLASICRFVPAKGTLHYSAPAGSNGESTKHFPEAFLRVLAKAVTQTMPGSLGQGFKDLDAVARRETYRPGCMRIESSFFHLDESRKFKIAHAIENDEVLIGMQHGGNAGTAAAIQFAPESEYRYHAAITWGWTSCGGYPGNFIPLPSPQLAPWIGKHNPTEDTIVVVGTGVRFIPGRFSFEGDIFNRPASRTEKLALFDGLSSDVRKKIRYRPYFGMQSTLADASYFEAKYPDIPQIKDGFFDRLMHCKLMVIDHPGTTMLQALAADIPLIGYWSPHAFYMCPEAKELFDHLRGVNVVFDNGADAARHMNKISNDIPGWWSRPDVQQAVHEVRETYAKASRTWLIDWAGTLMRL